MEEEQDNKIPLFPFQRGELLVKLNRVSDFKKVKLAYQSLCLLIETKEESMKSWRPPRNPREDVNQSYDKKKLEVWKRQKKHQEDQMLLLEKQIRKDIEDSKV